MATLYRIGGADSGDEQIKFFNDFCMCKLKEICFNASNSNLTECVFSFKPVLWGLRSY
jgi:hypothetical protein